MKKLFTLLFAATLALSAWATEYQIGTIGTYDKAQRTPFDVTNEYSISQSIYYASELTDLGATAGDITSISFRYDNTTALTRSVKVYIISTDKTSAYRKNIFSNYKFETVTDNDCYYIGTITTPTTKSFYTIDLAKNFAWDGEKNICVIIYDYTNSISSVKYHKAFSSTSARCIYAAGDVAYNVTAGSIEGKVESTGSGDNTWIPVIKFNINTSTTPTISTPENLTNNAEALTSNSATVSWDAVDGADSYTIRYKANDAADYTEIANISNTEYTLTGLAANTKYFVGVKAVKGSDESAYSSDINFTTKAEPYTFSDQTTADDLTAINGNTYDLTIDRTLSSASYNTLCLPVTMTKAKCDEIFGTAENTILEFKNAALENNNLVLEFWGTLTIQAGKPYLIKPAADITSWVLGNVTINNSTAPKVTSAVTFVPVLTPTEVAAANTNLLVGAGNTLFYPNETGTLKGMRAYFQVTDLAAAGAPARIGRIGNAATGIQNAAEAKKAAKALEEGRVIIRIDGRTYDLNGHLLK